MTLCLVEEDGLRTLARVKPERRTRNYQKHQRGYEGYVAVCPYCGASNSGWFESEYKLCPHFLFAEGKESGAKGDAIVYFCSGSLEEESAVPQQQIAGTLAIRFHFSSGLVNIPVVPEGTDYLPDVLEVLLENGDVPFLPYGPVFQTTSFLKIRFKMRYGWRISCKNEKVG